MVWVVEVGVWRPEVDQSDSDGRGGGEGREGVGWYEGGESAGIDG